MMEKEVGAPLIVRTTPIKLTAIGRKVLEKASVIAADHRLAREQKKHIQTVGGPILWATLERPEKG